MASIELDRMLSEALELVMAKGKAMLSVSVRNKVDNVLDGR